MSEYRCLPDSLQVLRGITRTQPQHPVQARHRIDVQLTFQWHQPRGASADRRPPRALFCPALPSSPGGAHTNAWTWPSFLELGSGAPSTSAVSWVVLGGPQEQHLFIIGSPGKVQVPGQDFGRQLRSRGPWVLNLEPCSWLHRRNESTHQRPQSMVGRAAADWRATSPPLRHLPATLWPGESWDTQTGVCGAARRRGRSGQSIGSPG